MISYCVELPQQRSPYVCFANLLVDFAALYLENGERYGLLIFAKVGNLE